MLSVQLPGSPSQLNVTINIQPPYYFTGDVGPQVSNINNELFVTPQVEGRKGADSRSGLICPRDWSKSRLGLEADLK